jgi:UDP-N-acetyl-D-galactosamine dehydrogenase
MVTFEQLQKGEKALGVVGLGYVGLPLAVALSRHFKVIGLDISERRVAEVASGKDHTREVEPADLSACSAEFSSDLGRVAECGMVLVAVPTPIDEHRAPDLTPVRGASVSVGRNLAPDTVVVYESTVWPGLTEDICGPILEKESGLKRGADFFLGYSPERINPGDRDHTLRTIVKVVAGENPEVTELLARVYGTVVEAGVHRAPGIAVAEAAKVIENTQRDLNIALMNELAMIFDRMGIDTLDVLTAAGTKWNFLPFRPGLVGGHCIGVDPYYLTFKAESLGFHPEVILAGRRTNDHLGKFVAEAAVKRLIRLGRRIKGGRVGVLGFTFKENVPDLRNTRVVDVIRELSDYGLTVLVHDPLADPGEAKAEYGLTLSPLEELQDLEALVLCVAHEEYRAFTPTSLAARFTPGTPVVADVKGFFDRKALAEAGFCHWRL